MSNSVQLKDSNYDKLEKNKSLEAENQINKTNDEKSDEKKDDEKHINEAKSDSRSKKSDVLKLEANRILKLFIPLSFCMLLVLLTIYFIPFFSTGIDSEIGNRIPFLEKEKSSTREKWVSVVITALIFLLLMIVVSTCITIVFIYEFYECITGFFIFAFTLYFGVFSLMFTRELCEEFNIAMDLITTLLIIWNFAIIGIIIIFIGGPKIMVQSYHVMMAALTALFFIKFMPPITTWAILMVMVLWDIYAVLHKNGPLKKLFDASQTKGQALPPIIYSAAIWLSAEKTSTTEDGSDVELGLGDFIFYSLLVGKTFTSAHLLTAIICFISILIGLAITLFLLLIYDRALPALPISIVFGIIAHVITVQCVNPFNDVLTSRQIFI